MIRSIKGKNWGASPKLAMTYDWPHGSSAIEIYKQDNIESINIFSEFEDLLQIYHETDCLGKNQRIQHGLQKHTQIYNAAGANENKPTQLCERDNFN